MSRHGPNAFGTFSKLCYNIVLDAVCEEPGRHSPTLAQMIVKASDLPSERWHNHFEVQERVWLARNHRYIYL